MKENEFKPALGATKNKKRRGRGNASGLGGEAGRGHKGQKSRSGFSRRAGFEGGQMPLYRRLPKKRGLGNPKKTYYFPINLVQLENAFNAGDFVSMETLIEKRIIDGNYQVKLLGSGSLTKKLNINLHQISKQALEKLKESASEFNQIS